jgi:molecular chaperone GrpE (heat shock protein)
MPADDIDDRLRRFEPADLDDDASLDTGQADQLLKLFTRLAKGQWKTQQKADHAAQKVADYLDEHSDRVTELKEERAALEDREEQYRRVLLEIMDLFGQLDETARRSSSDPLKSVATSMREKLEGITAKIGLERIPAQGESPDSLYHHVVDTREAGSSESPDTIVEVARQGYLLEGEVVRKADVIVAK